MYHGATNRSNEMYGVGYNAFHTGIDRDRNPYAEGSRWYEEWFKGWDAAARASTY